MNIEIGHRVRQSGKFESKRIGTVVLIYETNWCRVEYDSDPKYIDCRPSQLEHVSPLEELALLEKSL